MQNENITKQPGLVEITFSKTLETALNRAIALDEDNATGFNQLEGKVIAFYVAPFKPCFYCIINDSSVAISQNLMGQADCTLQTELNSWLNLTIESQFNATCSDGDKTIAQQFIQALEQLEVDWEELLSHYTGDLVAFKVGHGLRTFLDKKQSAKQQAGETIREYLQFEINSLPTKSQVKHFMKDVDNLQNDVDSIEQRIQSLQQHLTSNP